MNIVVLHGGGGKGNGCFRPHALSSATLEIVLLPGRQVYQLQNMQHLEVNHTYIIVVSLLMFTL